VPLPPALPPASPPPPAPLLTPPLPPPRGAPPTQNGLPLEPAPSFKQGFGRVNLTRALPLKENGWRMQAVDLAPLAQGETHRYCITATGGPLSITLNWYDYPGSPSSGGSALVNNLDLGGWLALVVGGLGWAVGVFGVRRALLCAPPAVSFFEPTTHAPPLSFLRPPAEVRAAGLAGALLRGNGFADDMNNVERVTAEDFPAGNVQIAVVGKRIPAVVGTQKYALVVQGRFSGVLASKYNPDATAAAVGSAGADGACVLTVPVIDRASAPGKLTKERAVQLAFGTKGGGAPAAGFQCKLAASKGPSGSAAALKEAGHDWKDCESPASYELPDGTFTFEVGLCWAAGLAAGLGPLALLLALAALRPSLAPAPACSHHQAPPLFLRTPRYAPQASRRPTASPSPSTRRRRR
jgi:hypothetical protein